MLESLLYSLVLFTGALPCAEDTALFLPLGDLPGGNFYSIALAVSADGESVVGQGVTTSASGEESAATAVLWRDGMIAPLNHVAPAVQFWAALAVNPTVTTVVGMCSNGTACVSVDLAPAISLPFPNPAMTQTYYNAYAHDLSADGRIIVGEADSYISSGFNQHSVREALTWTDGVPTKLEFLPETDHSPEGIPLPTVGAFAVSADGRIVVGYSVDVAVGNRAVRWVNGTIELLGTTEDDLEYAYDVSNDGSVVVGATRAAGPQGQRAFRWSNGEVLFFFDESYPAGSCEATAVSADGKVVVGRCSAATTYAFIWDEVNGLRRLADLLRLDHQLDIGAFKLITPYDVSANGQTIVGQGRHSDGTDEAWLVRLPPPRTILRSEPPGGTIDARADFSSSGATPKGVDRVRLTTSSIVTNLAGDGPPDAASFSVADSSGVPPVILDVVPVDGIPYTYDVVFDEPIKPGHWTTVTIDGARTDGLSLGDYGNTVTVGFLPGDVNGSRTTNAQDITALINSLNGVAGQVRPATSTDINWSGVTNAADITRLIDLLNGVNTSRPWIGQRLPN